LLKKVTGTARINSSSLKQV